jgi:hypothetical protein
MFRADLNFLTSLDKLLMLFGQQLKTLVPEWYTPFCTLVSCTGG